MMKRKRRRKKRMTRRRRRRRRNRGMERSAKCDEDNHKSKVAMIIR